MHLKNLIRRMNLSEITEQFSTEGTIVEITGHETGHINENFILRTGDPGVPDYFLQRINQVAFRDVELLMNNISLVTSHIASQVADAEGPGQYRRSLTLVPTRSGASWFTDPDGEAWRLFRYIDDHVVYERTTDPAIAREGARMFGEFDRMISGLPVPALGETIPWFHHIGKRLTALEEAITKDSSNRKSGVEEEISYVRSRAGLMNTILELGSRGAIPRRLTHNDTKISNVLFDRDGRGLCVVDLDTVMPGYIHYDFGDGIRTFTNTGKEDDADLYNVAMDLELYRAFAEGFLDATRGFLTPAETDTLVFGGILFPYLMGVRFLTDFLEGDIYYRTGFEEHNLVRARAQFRLAVDAEEKMEDCREMIRKIAR